VGLFVGLCLPDPESPVLWPSNDLEPPYAVDDALLVTEMPLPRDGVAGPGLDPIPVPCGLTTLPPLALGPMADGNLLGLTALAARLKAPRHCRTWAGSFCSKRSTVRKVSCWCKLKGGAWHARRKMEMFSI
jgi:hypothetical protein